MPRVKANRSEKQSYRSSTVAILLIICALGLVLVFTTGAASWVSDHVLLPIGAFFGMNRTPNPEVALETQDATSPSPDANERQILLPEQLQYYLQMGNYSDRTSADIQAKFIRSIGGAGYVYYDGAQYRVFAACYRDQQSAEKVQEQIRTDGYDSASYIIQTDAVNIRFTDAEEKGAESLNISNLACELASEVLEIIFEYDKQTIDAIGANTQIVDLILKIDTQLAELGAYTEFDAVCAYLDASKTFLSTFCETSGTLSKAEYSAALKHAQISISILYHETIMEL